MLNIHQTYIYISVVLKLLRGAQIFIKGVLLKNVYTRKTSFFCMCKILMARGELMLKGNICFCFYYTKYVFFSVFYPAYIACSDILYTWIMCVCVCVRKQYHCGLSDFVLQQHILSIKVRNTNNNNMDGFTFFPSTKK